MKVIWKRPDGFHQALPSDYDVYEVTENTRIWLHKDDHENYPFRVSGGWKDELATKELNSLVNLLPQPHDSWISFLKKSFDDSKSEKIESFLQEKLNWLDELSANLKGDTWELEIMTETLKKLKIQLNTVSKDLF